MIKISNIKWIRICMNLIVFTTIVGSTIPSFCFANDSKKEESQNSLKYTPCAYSVGGLRVATEIATGKTGVIDEEGNTIISFIYDYGTSFNNSGYAILYKKNGAAVENNIVNPKGELIKIGDGLGEVSYYNGEFGIVNKSESYALIDSKGNLLTDYNNYMHYDGQANGTNAILINKNDKWGLLNSKGQGIVPIEYDYMSNEYMYLSKISRVDNPDVFKVVKNDKCGFIRNDGKVLVNCIYDDAHEFEEGYGRIKKNGRWAVIDKNGNFVTDSEFDDLGSYKEGIAVVVKNGKYGCIDTTGQLVLPYKYSLITEMENGEILAYLEGNTCIKVKNPLIEKRNVNIYLDGQWLYTDQEPEIQNDRAIAPFRSVAEALGYKVQWEDTTKTIILQNSMKIIHLQIGSNEATINSFDDGKEPIIVQLDVPTSLVNGRTFVPVRFIAENIGANVTWDQKSKTIQIKTI